MANNAQKKAILTSTLIALVILFTWLFVSNEETVEAADAEQAPAKPVTVNIVKPEKIQLWKDFSARTEAVGYAEIRPQVSGIIQQVKFSDGQQVKKGDVLYLIDPRTYETAVDLAKAELAAAQNQATFARKELSRNKKLVQSKTVSKRIFDGSLNDSLVAEANINGAKARLEQALINLNYAYVKAPISGRISRNEIKQGNLVSTGANAPLLTSIVATDGIYADFEVDEQTYLTQVRITARDQETEKNIPVKLILSDNSQYDGFIDSFDNRIDTSSGTIRARAYFDNKDAALLPGMFAKISMGSANKQELILISEHAIGTDQSKKFLYVVDDENKVAYREVKLGKSIDGKRIITSGINTGDKVIIDGIIRIRPGMLVEPVTKETMANNNI